MCSDESTKALPFMTNLKIPNRCRVRFVWRFFKVCLANIDWYFKGKLDYYGSISKCNRKIHCVHYEMQ